MNPSQLPGNSDTPESGQPIPGRYDGPVQYLEDQTEPPLSSVPPVRFSDAQVTRLPDDPPAVSGELDQRKIGPAFRKMPPTERRMLVLAVVALVLLVLAVMGSRLAMEFIELHAFSPLLGWCYLAVILLVICILGYWAGRSWRRYQRVRDVSELRELVAAYQKPPRVLDADDRLRLEWQGYLAELEGHADLPIQECVNHVRKKFNDYSGDAAKDLEIVELFLLEHLDRRADLIIETRAVQTAVSTALASRLFDALIVFCQCLGLVNQLARLYAGRPGIWGTFRLFRRGTAMLVFAEVADLAGSMLTEALAQKSLQALGARMTEGFANGVLMLRFGEAVKLQCRPAPVPRPASNSILRLNKALFTQGVKLPRTEGAV